MLTVSDCKSVEPGLTAATCRDQRRPPSKSAVTLTAWKESLLQDKVRWTKRHDNLCKHAVKAQGSGATPGMNAGHPYEVAGARSWRRSITEAQADV